jgi:hypothetical protein
VLDDAAALAGAGVPVVSVEHARPDSPTRSGPPSTATRCP